MPKLPFNKKKVGGIWNMIGEIIVSVGDVCKYRFQKTVSLFILLP